MEPRKKKEILADILERKRNVVDLIIEMKNLSSLIVDLGFSALLLQDKKLAEKVEELEEELDIRQYEIETECMLAANTPEEALGLTSVTRMSSAVEDIANAVRELIDSVIRGIPIHPTISKALAAAADTVAYVNVPKKAKVAGNTVEGLTQNKVDVVGLKRDGIWSYLPKRTEKIKAGDMLIISGKKKEINEIKKAVK